MPKLKIRLSYIFLLINSVILSLPVGGIALLQLYDSTLIRQTENALIAQAVMLSNIYKKSLKEQFPQLDLKHYGKPLAKNLWLVDDEISGKWHPIPAQLDLTTTPILPVAPNPQKTKQKADSIAWQLGLQFDDLLKETQLTTLAGMRITDVNGIIVSTTGWIKGSSLLNRNELVQALQGKMARVLRERTAKDPRNFFSPISRTSDIRVHITYPIVLNHRIIGAVYLIRTPASVAQTLYQNKTLFIVYGLLLLAIVFSISLFMSYAITKPIKALVAQAKKATNGSLNKLTPLKHPVTAEFALLSQTLVEMADKQAQRAEQIKNFASYVSHEFKTPITAIKGAVEILQDHLGDLSELEQTRFLQNIEQNSQRMQLLMQQLTELAKADTTKVPEQACDLITIIKQQCQLYQDRFETIRFDHKEKNAAIYMNKELLTSIIANLFENVAQHGGNKITIELNKQRSIITLNFIDNGQGISAHNAKRIFEPFFTTAKENGGTGLGLAIISTLLTAHKGSISLLPLKTGCGFQLNFPY